MEVDKINMLPAITMLFLLTFVSLAISGEKIPDEKELGIPLYTEMQFLGYKTIKGGITLAQYCSSSSPALILKFYKKDKIPSRTKILFFFCKKLRESFF